MIFKLQASLRNRKFLNSVVRDLEVEKELGVRPYIFSVCFDADLGVEVVFDYPLDGSSNESNRRCITITVPASLFETLEEESTNQGRSISNLSTYLLECATMKRRFKLN